MAANTTLPRSTSFDWAIKLAIEKICDKLPPETIWQVNEVVQAGLGIKKQLDRIEYVQIEIFKMLEASNARYFQAKSGDTASSSINRNGTEDLARNFEPPAATGE